MTTRKKNTAAAVTKETKAVEKRRKVILNALMSGHHSPEREGAKDDILHSYPQLRSLVTDMPPVAAEPNPTATADAEDSKR